MAKETIQKLEAREILDSRGDPTVEVTVQLEGGAIGMAAVPSGASTGIHEAFELRDEDKARYQGKGVLKAVAAVEGEFAQAVCGTLATDQRRVDQILIDTDGTANKHRLGANACLGVSLAVARAGAAVTDLPLYRYLRQAFGLAESPYTMPLLMLNILNGGAHADNELDVQEFMVVPRIESAGKPLAAESIRVGSEVFHALGQVLKSEGLDTDVGNEGGYAPALKESKVALDLLVRAVEKAGYKPGEDVFLALDVASSEFFRQGHYLFEGKKLTGKQLTERYTEWVGKYPITLLEDGLAQDDWDGWADLTGTLGGKLHIVGDDLFVTNSQRLQLGFSFKAANAIIIKPNQVGTLSETMDTVSLARDHGYATIVSHRSGETMDTFISDLAVAVSSSYLKSGSTSRGERVAKYNRLMEIESEIIGSR